jgi:cell division transport system permease protein
MRLRFIAGEVWNGLRRNGTMALSVVLVTFVSLTLVGAAALTQIQVEQLREDWYGRVEISVFLCSADSTNRLCVAGPATTVDEDAIRAVLDNGSVAELIETWEYESAQEAFDRFMASDESGQFSYLTPEQIGASFRIKLNDPSQYEVVADALEGLPGVDVVVDQREIFAELFRFLNAATFVAAGLAGVMLLTAVLLITTTIRLSALSRKRETSIMRMVGSSRMLIQAPFMLEGAVAATIGALLASTALWVGVKYFLHDWLRQSVPWINYIGAEDVMRVAPWLLAVAAGLALVSSAVTIGKYTRA